MSGTGDEWLQAGEPVPPATATTMPNTSAQSYPPMPMSRATSTTAAPIMRTQTPSISGNEQLNDVDLSSPSNPSYPPSRSVTGTGVDGLADVALDQTPPFSSTQPTSSAATSANTHADPTGYRNYAQQQPPMSTGSGYPYQAAAPSVTTQQVGAPIQSGPLRQAEPTLYGSGTAATDGSHRPMPSYSAASASSTSQSQPALFMPRMPMPGMSDASTMPVPSMSSASNASTSVTSNLQPPPTTWQQQVPQTHHAHMNGHTAPHVDPSSFSSSSIAAPGMYGSSSSAMTSHRPWTPAPAHPIVSFGFGGKFLTILTSSSSTHGSVEVKPLSDVFASLPHAQQETKDVDRMNVFPGPLALASATPTPLAKRKAADAAVQAEVEKLTMQWMDEADTAALPADSPLLALYNATSDESTRTKILAQYRFSVRLLSTLLWKVARRKDSVEGRIHRATNPASMQTLPTPQRNTASVVDGISDKRTSIEEAMAAYLSGNDETGSSDGVDGDSSSSQWLDGASSASVLSQSLVSSPIRSSSSSSSSSSSTTVADSLELVEERKKQDASVARMQSLLLRGERKGACQLAIEHRLWSHALLLASFDMATYQHVVGQFATMSFTDGSPLQSLYLLFAQQPQMLFRGVRGPDGRGLDGKELPEVVPLIDDPATPPFIKHWRANLSMILANPTPNDKQVLTTLGDTLWNNYHLPHAAHACYLLAGHALGPDLPGSAVGGSAQALAPGRIMLLGSDHRKHRRTFITIEALQRTEVLEYTQQLAAVSTVANGGNAHAYGGLTPGFQLFKLVYAYRLAEVGLLQKALKYVEQLNQIVQICSTPSKHAPAGSSTTQFPPSFLHLLESLEGRLREVLNVKSGPGVGKRIVSSIFNWMVGESAQPKGTTTVVPLSTSSSTSNQQQPSNLQRSVSTSVLSLSHQTAAAPPSNPQLHASTSDMNLSSHRQFQQPHHVPPTPAPTRQPTGMDEREEPSVSAPPPSKHIRSVTEPQAGLFGGKKNEGAPSSSASPPGEGNANGTATKKPGLLGRMVGTLGTVGTLFGGGSSTKKVAKVAKLDSELTFSWDEKLGRHVFRDANGVIQEEEENEDKPIPPPTISDEMKAKLSGMQPQQQQQQPHANGTSTQPSPDLPSHSTSPPTPAGSSGSIATSYSCQ